VPSYFSKTSRYVDGSAPSGQIYIKEEVGITVREWLGMQQSGSCGGGIFKPVPRGDNCSNMLAVKPLNDDNSA